MGYIFLSRYSNILPWLPPPRNSGNVLFLILIAVALFAALAYAVTSSSRSGGGNAKTESVTAQAAAIMQWFSSLDTAIMRMRMNGIPIEQISSLYTAKRGNGADIVVGDNINCTMPSCRIFDSNGGGIIPIRFTAQSINSASWPATRFAPGYHETVAISWPDAGTSAIDIAIRVRVISPDVCNEINKKLTIDVPVFTGSSKSGHDPTQWDTSTSVCSSNCSSLSGATIYTLYEFDYCDVYHLLITR